MWGTSSPEDKLTGDLGNVIEATSTGVRRSDFFTAEKLAPGNLGLLQQYLAMSGLVHRGKRRARVAMIYSITSSARATRKICDQRSKKTFAAKSARNGHAPPQRQPSWRSNGREKAPLSIRPLKSATPFRNHFLDRKTDS